MVTVSLRRALPDVLLFEFGLNLGFTQERYVQAPDKGLYPEVPALQISRPHSGAQGALR